jgi:hypothetical protein
MNISQEEADTVALMLVDPTMALWVATSPPAGREDAIRLALTSFWGANQDQDPTSVELAWSPELRSLSRSVRADRLDELASRANELGYVETCWYLRGAADRLLNEPSDPEHDDGSVDVPGFFYREDYRRGFDASQSDVRATVENFLIEVF